MNNSPDVSGATNLKMGALEQRLFERACRAWKRFRSDAAAKPTITKADSPNLLGPSERKQTTNRLSSSHFGASGKISSYNRNAAPPMPETIAARLMLARLFDGSPDMLAMRPAPIVVIDVGDRDLLDAMSSDWTEVLFERGRVCDVEEIENENPHDFDAVSLFIEKPLKSIDKIALQKRCRFALQLGIPFIAVSPLGETHLPEVVLNAAGVRLEVPKLDASIISKVLRIVTGRPFGKRLDLAVLEKTGMSELAIAVRYDRTPKECVDEFHRLARLKTAKKMSRDLRLDELHGMREAVTWARATIADIGAWRRGGISWDSLDNVVLNGPPGTGKTTFARVAASAFGFNLVTATLARWQSAGEGHLGHLLRAMRHDFERARALAPCVFFLDEVDSFADRNAVRHAYRDYSIQVTNALLEQVDGLAGRDGLIFIAATNDVRRCDPALLRAGRLNRVIEIGLPDEVERNAMLRVRLREDLCRVDLQDIVEATVGMTGADIEKLVKDARRIARLEARDISIADLRKAVLANDVCSEAVLRRACAHEAGHLVAEVLLDEPDGVSANTFAVGGRVGMTVRKGARRGEGTFEDHFRQLQISLAGRIAEELLLGKVGDGAGGSDGSDLSVATSLAASMVGSLGLAGPTPLLYLGSARDAATLLLFPEVRQAVNALLRSAETACRALIAEHRAVLSMTSQRLFERKRVNGHQVAGWLGLTNSAALDI